MGHKIMTVGHVGVGQKIVTLEQSKKHKKF